MYFYLMLQCPTPSPGAATRPAWCPHDPPHCLQPVPHQGALHAPPQATCSYLSPVPGTDSIDATPQQPVTWVFGGRQAWGPQPEHWGLPAGRHHPPRTGLGCCSACARLHCTLSRAAGCASLLDSAHPCVSHARRDNAAVLRRMLGLEGGLRCVILPHWLGVLPEDRRVHESLACPRPDALERARLREKGVSKRGCAAAWVVANLVQAVGDDVVPRVALLHRHPSPVQATRQALCRPPVGHDRLRVLWLLLLLLGLLVVVPRHIPIAVLPLLAMSCCPCSCMPSQALGLGLAVRRCLLPCCTPSNSSAWLCQACAQAVPCAKPGPAVVRHRG